MRKRIINQGAEGVSTADKNWLDLEGPRQLPRLEAPSGGRAAGEVRAVSEHPADAGHWPEGEPDRETPGHQPPAHR